ncbi:hypothetical protein K438DRAFT_1823216 [Mycena galopus ATCC 62051]|nr:hypothetical protein K438DRAFT_1878473 [Mycena galopus ATCC 62051]KAF8199215.1 hypothetical protein K438DRAFT_1823216 [Mycena galopus ATCC 62051]
MRLAPYHIISSHSARLLTAAMSMSHVVVAMPMRTATGTSALLCLRLCFRLVISCLCPLSLDSDFRSLFHTCLCLGPHTSNNR